MQHKHIGIIGGGIGGLMTAIALNRKGISSTVYEKAATHNPNGAGLSLWANATKLLDEHGLLEKLLSCGNALNEMHMHTPAGKRLGIVHLKKLEQRFHFPSIILLRSDLQQVLLNAVPETQVRFNRQYESIDITGIKPIVHFTDGTSETADGIIFADGIHSQARTALFQFPALQYAGRASWRGIAAFDRTVIPETTSCEIFGQGKRIGIFPLKGNKAYWYAAVNMPEQESMKQRPTQESVLSHFSNWSEPVNTLIKSTPENKIILTNINFTPSIHQLVKGPAALLGDAAHPMTPDLGQGACQAIEDACVMAECIATNSAIADAFKAYEQKRLTRVNTIAARSYSIGKMRQAGNPIGAIVRNTMMRVLPEGFALRMLARNIRQ